MSQQIPDQDTASKREGGILIPFSILTDETITNTEKHVYSYVLAFNVNGLDFFCGSESTGLKLGLNPVQVRRAIARLCNLGYLTRAKSNGMSVLRCNKLLQLSDPIVTNRSPVCNESLQQTTQIVTHNNNTNKNLNNKSNNTETSDEEPSLKCESESPSAKRSQVTKEAKTPSPKVPAKGVPCPDHEDDSLRVRMPIERWDKLCEQLGEECCIHQCSNIEEYLDENPGRVYKDFAATIRKYHNRATKDGHVFGWSKDGGYSYKKPWAPGFKVGGKNG